MKLKYKVKQREDGKWYVFKRKGIYFTVAYETKEAAIGQSLVREGRELLDKLDTVQNRMESIPGFIDSRDPYGWRA